MCAIISLPGRNNEAQRIAKRNKAIIAFVFATGVRDGPLIGLKIKHLNIAKKYIVQDPKEVATKFRKRIMSAKPQYPASGDANLLFDMVDNKVPANRIFFCNVYHPVFNAPH